MPSTLYAAVLETRNYIVGEANAASGLYRRSAATWAHHGWTNVRCFGMAHVPATPSTLFLACGNGVLRSRDAGRTWRVTTDWRITEVLDLAWSPTALYAATAYGVWRSPDEGDSWEAFAEGLTVPSETYTPVLRIDRTQPGRLFAGTEAGLFRLDPEPPRWIPVGPRYPIRCLVQATDTPARWYAGTEDHGLLYSEDAGHTWQPDGGPQNATFYAVALPDRPAGLIVAAGYQSGLYVSTDGGTSWTRRPLPLLTASVHALAFDPDVPGRLWIGVVGEGALYTDDLGRTYREAGLPETTVYAFHFVHPSPPTPTAA